jgi:glycosyltransferase involved in cell wall biosynthesis
MDEKIMKLSIIIPAFHEGKNILPTIKEIIKFVKTDNEIIIICDEKSDPTINVINNLKKKNIYTALNSIGSMKGPANAVKTGFLRAKGDLVSVVMADLSDDLKKVDKGVKMIDKDYDMVCFSRYMRGGRQIGGPFLKGLMSRIAGLSLFYLFNFPTHDPTNSFKLYRKTVLKKIKIESSAGFDFNLELIVKAHKMGYKIGEIPATWRDRTAGKSRFKLLKWLPKYLKWYWYLLVN